MVINRYEETIHRTSRNLLCWLKSNHPHISYSKPFTLVKHTSSTIKYRSLLKKAVASCFRVYRIDAKQRERLIGVHFNKKLCHFLNAIWHHKDLAHDFLAAERVAEIDKKASEDKIHVEYEDMDLNKNIYGDLVTGDDDDDDDDDKDDSDLYNTSEDDSDDDDAYMSTEDDHHQPSKSATSPGKAKSLASLAELVFGLSLALCTERLTDGQPSSTVLMYFSDILTFSEATNSFQNTRSYTPYLSGFIYI
jgi:hypothetical protein